MSSKDFRDALKAIRTGQFTNTRIVVEDFNFGSTKGSSKVSAAELDKFRTASGNPAATLGQYMNARDGKTAIAGGKNALAAQDQDQDSDQDADANDVATAKAPSPTGNMTGLRAAVANTSTKPANFGNLDGAKAALPNFGDLSGAKAALPNFGNLSGAQTALANSQPNFGNLDGAKAALPDKPSPFGTLDAIKPVLPKPTPNTIKPIPPKNNDDDEDLDESTNNKNGKIKMAETLIERFMSLHKSKNTNIFEAAKAIGPAVHDTKGKDYAVTSKGGMKATKPDPMPHLEKDGSQLKDGKVSRGSIPLPQDKMPKLDVSKAKSHLESVGMHAEAALLDEMYARSGVGFHRAQKEEDDLWDRVHGKQSTKSKEKSSVWDKVHGESKPIDKKKKVTKEEVELEEKFNEVYGDRLVEAKEDDTGAEFKKGFTDGYAGGSSAAKASRHYFKGFEQGKSEKGYDTRSGKYYKGNGASIADKKCSDYFSYGPGSVCESIEELDTELFSEEELEHLAAILEDGEAPVKRGRGRPPGSKSGSKLGRETGEEGESYGTRNVAAQMRTARPYFKGGTEVKKITHPTKNTEHEIPLKHLNQFTDDYTEADKPRDKEAVEAAFVKKHMS